MTTSQPMAFDAEKENLVLDAVERFVEREIKPVAQRLEHADEWPADIVAGMREMGLQWARGMVHPDRLDTPLFSEVLDMVARFTPEVFAAQINALLNRPDAGDVLRQLRCPTLLACGRQDTWSPLSRHERMQALCPGAELVVIEDSGHMSTMEQPQQVSRALLDWMGR